MSEDVSEKVVMQRIRNRVIEVLNLFSDDDSFDIAVSNLESWGDWVDMERINVFQPPVFTEREVEEIKNVNDCWDRVFPTSHHSSKELRDLANASKQALIVFSQRGLLSEESEIA